MKRSKAKNKPRTKPPFTAKRNKLGVLLFALGVTTDHAAVRFGISPSYLSAIVNGQSVPSDETLERIASVLDVQFTPAFELLAPVTSESLSGALRAFCGVD